MLGLDAFHLARIQFAFTVSFHIIFPAITIGLASYLAVLEGLWLKTGNPVWRSLYHFWSKIFAVNFGMGVVSGLVMAYQFGNGLTNLISPTGGVLLAGLSIARVGFGQWLRVIMRLFPLLWITSAIFAAISAWV